jgi:hypothetical protein
MLLVPRHANSFLHHLCACMCVCVCVCTWVQSVQTRGFAVRSSPVASGEAGRVGLTVGSYFGGFDDCRLCGAGKAAGCAKHTPSVRLPAIH